MQSGSAWTHVEQTGLTKVIKDPEVLSLNVSISVAILKIKTKKLKNSLIHI